MWKTLTTIVLVTGCSRVDHTGEGKHQRPAAVSIPGGDFLATRAPCLPTPKPDPSYDPTDTIQSVKGFEIDREVTSCAAYQKCVDAGACQPLTNPRSELVWNLCDHGVIAVAQADRATAYCTWLGGRLPSFLEWQRAIRGSKPVYVERSCEHETYEQTEPHTVSRCEHRSPDGVTFAKPSPNSNEWTSERDCWGDRLIRGPAAVSLGGSLNQLRVVQDVGAEFRCVYDLPTDSSIMPPAR